MADRKLIVQILGDSRQLERTFARSSRDASKWGKSLERAGRGGLVATVGFRGLGRSIAFASGAFLGGAGFVAGARAAIKASSDLAEEQNKTRVLFGESAGEIRRWSKTTATALGLSRRAAQQAAGNFGAMFETLRLGDAASTTMSKRLVQLGADLASFANEDPSEMLERLRGGLSGEAEPLRRFGILLSEARVKTEAYASGLAKSGAELTEQQKVLARFNLILADSTAAQGDFARTSQSQANQERINAALREEAAERIGRLLLPLYNQATRAVNKWLGEEKNLAQIQKTTQRIVTTSTQVVKAFVDVAQDIAPVLQRANKLLGGTANAVKLLLTVFVVTKVVAFTGAITGLGAASLATTGRVNTLRASLLRLGAIGTIVIGVEVIMNRNAIHDKVTNFLQKNAPFLVPDGLKIPLDIDSRQLEDVRNRLAAIKGEGDATVVILDRFIKKLREVEQARLKTSDESRGEGRSAEGIERKNRSLERQARQAALEAARQIEAARLRSANATEKEVVAANKVTAATKGQVLTQRELLELERERARTRASQRQARQFQALGLTADGGEAIPGVAALKARLGNLRDQLKGTPLDTDKTRAQLARIAKVLSGAFGKAGRDVRQTILGMFNDISAAFAEGGGAKGGPLTKTSGLNSKKILEGLGLNPEQANELRGRLSSFNTAGRAPRAFASSTTGGVAGGFAGAAAIVVESHTTINLDGQRLITAVTRGQQKAKKRNPQQKRGPNRIGGV